MDPNESETDGVPKCTRCGLPRGDTYEHTAKCKACFSAVSYAREKIRRRRPEYRARALAKSKARRADRKYRARFILKDSRASDKKYGRENDLTVVLIERLISTGCRYCGETQLKMTLDRIDNSVGHIGTNVVPCCIRCNYVRRDMPVAAWTFVAEAMRSARAAGAFGEWACDIRRGGRNQ